MSVRYSLIFIPLVVLLFVPSAKGTELPPYVDHTLVLSAEDNPHFAKTDLVVRPNAVLIIEPGVLVYFLPTRDRYPIWKVFGSLEILGQPDKQAVFRRSDIKPDSAYWPEIIIIGSSVHQETNPTLIRFAEFEGFRSVTLLNSAGTLFKVQFKLGVEGLRIINSPKTQLFDCSFKQMKHYGIYASFSETVSISDCSFSDSQGGIEFNNIDDFFVLKSSFSALKTALSSRSSEGSIQNSDFENNWVATEVYGISPLNVTESKFTDNLHGIYSFLEHIRLRENSFSQNLISAVTLVNGSSAVTERNVFNRNTTALTIRNEPPATIKNNDFLNNIIDVRADLSGELTFISNWWGAPQRSIRKLLSGDVKLTVEEPALKPNVMKGED